MYEIPYLKSRLFLEPQVTYTSVSFVLFLKLDWASIVYPFVFMSLFAVDIFVVSRRIGELFSRQYPWHSTPIYILICIKLLTTFWKFQMMTNSSIPRTIMVRLKYFINITLNIGWLSFHWRGCYKAGDNLQIYFLSLFIYCNTCRLWEKKWEFDCALLCVFFSLCVT
jgi:hypothetical protein